MWTSAPENQKKSFVGALRSQPAADSLKTNRQMAQQVAQLLACLTKNPKAAANVNEILAVPAMDVAVYKNEIGFFRRMLAMTLKKGIRQWLVGVDSVNKLLFSSAVNYAWHATDVQIENAIFMASVAISNSIVQGDKLDYSVVDILEAVAAHNSALMTNIEHQKAWHTVCELQTFLRVISAVQNSANGSVENEAELAALIDENAVSLKSVILSPPQVLVYELDEMKEGLHLLKPAFLDVGIEAEAAYPITFAEQISILCNAVELKGTKYVAAVSRAIEKAKAKQAHASSLLWAYENVCEDGSHCTQHKARKSVPFVCEVTFEAREARFLGNADLPRVAEPPGFLFVPPPPHQPNGGYLLRWASGAAFDPNWHRWALLFSAAKTLVLEGAMCPTLIRAEELFPTLVRAHAFFMSNARQDAAAQTACSREDLGLSAPLKDTSLHSNLEAEAGRAVSNAGLQTLPLSLFQVNPDLHPSVAVLDIVCTQLATGVPLYVQKIVDQLAERTDVDPKFRKTQALRFAAWTSMYRLSNASKQWQSDADPLQYVSTQGKARCYALSATDATTSAIRSMAHVLAQRLRMHHRPALEWWLGLYVHDNSHQQKPTQNQNKSLIVMQR